VLIICYHTLCSRYQGDCSSVYVRHQSGQADYKPGYGGAGERLGSSLRQKRVGRGPDHIRPF